MAKHRCGLECYKVKGSRLYHACKKCKHSTVSPVYPKLSSRAKSCAKKYVPAMISEWKGGRFSSKEQAIAVGLSKARRGC